MGGCTSNIYLTLKKQHGEAFKKFIIGSQSLTYLKREVKMKLQELDDKIQQKRRNLHAEIDQREQMMMFHFNEAKIQIDSSIPGGVSDYEQMKRVKIDSILNLQDYKNRFKALHEHIDKEIKQKQKKAHQNLQQIVHEAQKENTVDAQKMNLFHEMAEQKRAQIRHKGVKEFDKEIRSKIVAMELKYTDQLDTHLQMKKFDRIISLDKVDQLIQMAGDQFKTETLNIIGGNLDSSIKV